jgi:hypothetical protein
LQKHERTDQPISRYSYQHGCILLSFERHLLEVKQEEIVVGPD